MMTRRAAGALLAGLLGGALTLGLGSAASAAVKPHGLFTDGAVLQRGVRVPVWGAANTGERVTVEFQGQKVNTTAKDGAWKVWLKPLKAGGPFTLTVSGENTVEVKNVLVGEVWIASGQSNMEWPLTATKTGEQAIAGSADPELRLLTIAKATSDTPVREVTARWMEAKPDTTPRFSAVAYHFARTLRQRLKVPVGIIHTSWGGTYAEAWTSRETLQSEPGLTGIVPAYEMAKRTYPFRMMEYRNMVEAQRTAALAEGKEPPKPPNPPGDPGAAGNPNRPSVLYNAMIAPLIPYAIQGAIWYQGESNAGRAYQYQTLFPTMIRNWREDWGQPDLGFYLVQLAPFMAITPEPTESAWAELREAQRLTTLRLPHTGMAVITDVGDEKDIHPRDKQPVGERLAFAALDETYGMPVEGSGPAYAGMKVEGGKIVLRFDHAEGLAAKGGKLTGFTIAGADRKWVNADAEIRGRTVVVSSPSVSNPVAVRYGWANFPVLNLWNGAGLPASPFRTDEFPLTTQPK